MFSPHYALFLTQGKAVGDHGDEFAVCRLAFDVRHGVAEEFLQNLDIAAIPRDLDGMAYCTLDARRRCAEFFSDLGIQHLGDGIDYIHVVYRKYYRLAQVLIALYVRRNADLVDDLGDCRFEICIARARRQKHLLLARQRADLADAIPRSAVISQGSGTKYAAPSAVH